MNVREAVEKTAQKHGWSRIVGDIDGEIWAKGEQRLVVRYKMFGAVNNYMLRYYGKDPRDGVNWGVEVAFHDDEPFAGKNKKKQILTFLRNN